MKVLLSNDDGVLAPGLRMLFDTLAPMSHCWMVAPDRDCSGASSSLTLDRPLRLLQHSEHCYSVNGTPADCVHLALNGALEQQPDMVITGINAGANLGDDVLYSGTVAGALEGRFLSYPALAVSLCSRDSQHLASAAWAVKTLFPHISRLTLPPRSIINMNVPNLPIEKIQGFQVTRLGQRHTPLPIQKSADPRNHPVYWIGSIAGARHSAAGTDFHAIAEGYVSITPLQVDQTHYETFTELDQWLSAL